MTAEDFNRWLAEMKAEGIIRFQKEAALLLGITENGLLKMKKQGTTMQTALACRARLNGLEPYP